MCLCASAYDWKIYGSKYIDSLYSTAYFSEPRSPHGSARPDSHATWSNRPSAAAAARPLAGGARLEGSVSAGHHLQPRGRGAAHSAAHPARCPGRPRSRDRRPPPDQGLHRRDREPVLMARPRGRAPLNVFLNGRLVGHLRRQPSGAVDFQYASTWLAWEHSLPVSLSLPLREDRFSGDPVIAVFDNLLPDNIEVRRRLAERTHAQGSDPFSLLFTIGRDCVGALQFLPDGP